LAPEDEIWVVKNSYSVRRGRSRCGCQRRLGLSWRSRQLRFVTTSSRRRSCRITSNLPLREQGCIVLARGSASNTCKRG